MSVELLYTSAVQGLKQGSRGFCTVISTAGMPINLATRLEGLSAYRHIYPPNHPDAAKNPVNYSHLRISVGGRPVSILSRVADYGIDYSQRTNKLAHHVVVEAHEQTPAGPAWLMQSTSILRSRWDGQCATPASGPTVPMQDQTGKICTTWKSLSGDAGWGGVVADTFASAVGKPLWIIYDLGQREQLLTLLNEAIALLPHEKRWSATFSTYATNVPPDADCKVRCVPAGSDDARLAPAMGKVIDLTKKQAVLAVSELVTAAREGIVFTPKPVPSVPRPMVVEIPQVHSNAREPDLNDFELVEDDFEMKLKPIGPPSVTSSHLPPSPPPAVRSRPTSQPNYAQLSPDTPDSNSWMKWALIGTSVTIVCLMIAIGGLLYSTKFKDVVAIGNPPSVELKEPEKGSLDESKALNITDDQRDKAPQELDQHNGTSNSQDNSIKSKPPGDKSQSLDSQPTDPSGLKSLDNDGKLSETATLKTEEVLGAKTPSTKSIVVESPVDIDGKKTSISSSSKSDEMSSLHGVATGEEPLSNDKRGMHQDRIYVARLSIDRLYDREPSPVVDLEIPIEKESLERFFFAKPQGSPPYKISSINQMAVQDLANRDVKSLRFVEKPEAMLLVRLVVKDESVNECFKKMVENDRSLRGKVESWNKSTFGFVSTVVVSKLTNADRTVETWEADLKRLHDDMVKAKSLLDQYKPYEDVAKDTQAKFNAGFIDVSKYYSELQKSIAEIQDASLDSGDIVFIESDSSAQQRVVPLNVKYKISLK